MSEARPDPEAAPIPRSTDEEDAGPAAGPGPAPPQDLYWAIGLLLAVVPLTVSLGRVTSGGVLRAESPAMWVTAGVALLGAAIAILLHRRLAPRHAELGVVMPAGMILVSTVLIRGACADASAWAWVHPTLCLVEGFAAAGGLFPLLRHARTQRAIPEPTLVARSFVAGIAAFALFGALAGSPLAFQSGGPRWFAFAAALAAASLWALYRMPVVFMRFLAWALTHMAYRMRIGASEHISLEGPQVLVCNHISFIDWLFIAAASPRPPRFVMDQGMFRLPVVRTLCTIGEVIPIAPRKQDPAQLERALEEIARTLDAGGLICIFPEGAITRDGRMQVFRPGIERILARNPAPVVPMALGGLWGSFFSRVDGRAMAKPFRRGPWSPIALAIGPPIPPEEVTAEGLRERVADLLVEAEEMAGSGRQRDDVA